MSQYIEMPVNLTLVMQNEYVIDQIIHYLKYGSFNTNQTLRPLLKPKSNTAHWVYAITQDK